MERDVGDKKCSLLITHTCPPPPTRQAACPPPLSRQPACPPPPTRQAAGWFLWNLVSPPLAPAANNERRSENFSQLGIIQLADEIQLKETGGREEERVEAQVENMFLQREGECDLF